MNEKVRRKSVDVLAAIAYQLPVLIFYVSFGVFNEIQRGFGDYSMMRELGVAVLVAGTCMNIWRGIQKNQTNLHKGKFAAIYLGGIAILFLMAKILLHGVLADNYAATMLLIVLGVLFFCSLLAPIVVVLVSALKKTSES